MATTWRNGPNKHFWACVGFSEPPVGHYAPDVDQCQNESCLLFRVNGRKPYLRLRALQAKCPRLVWM